MVWRELTGTLYTVCCCFSCIIIEMTISLSCKIYMENGMEKRNSGTVNVPSEVQAALVLLLVCLAIAPVICRLDGTLVGELKICI